MWCFHTGIMLAKLTHRVCPNEQSAEWQLSNRKESKTLNSTFSLRYIRAHLVSVPKHYTGKCQASTSTEHCNLKTLRTSTVGAFTCFLELDAKKKRN